MRNEHFHLELDKLVKWAKNKWQIEIMINAA